MELVGKWVQDSLQIAMLPSWLSIDDNQGTLAHLG